MHMRHLPLLAAVTVAALVAVPRDVSAQGALERLGNLLQQAESAAEDTPAGADRETQTRPAYLGAVLDNVDPDVPGLIVLQVNPGGPAERAGLRVADVIVSANGQEVTNLEEFTQFFRTLSPGDDLVVELEREGQSMERTLALTPPPAGDTPADAEATPGEEPLPPPEIPRADPGPQGREGRDPDPLGLEGMTPPPEERPADPPARGKLGVRVVPLTEPIREQYGIAVNRGALVQSVNRGSVADQGGIPVGAVIVGFHGRRVDSPADLVELVRVAPLDRPVTVNYYLNNRTQSTELSFGEPPPQPQLPVQPPPPRPEVGPPPGDERDRPGLRLLERALDGIQRDQVPPGNDQQEVIELRNRVQQLEAELENLRRELAATRENGTPPPENVETDE